MELVDLGYSVERWGDWDCGATGPRDLVVELHVQPEATWTRARPVHPPSEDRQKFRFYVRFKAAETDGKFPCRLVRGR